MRIFNNYFMNSCLPPMGFNHFMGGCCNSFNPMLQFGMMNSLFSMPQMYLFPSFSMPMFSPMSMMSNYTMPSLPMSGNIFSMANSTMSMPTFSPMMNFGLPAMLSELSLLNQTLSSFGNLTAKKSKKTASDNSPVKDTGKLDKHFLKKVKQVAKNINCDYKDLLAVMNSESSLNPKSGNVNSAVGLIQFTKDAIAQLNKTYSLNVTKEKILQMSPIEQLDLAEKYFLMAKKQTFGNTNRKMTAADLYAVTFLPGRAGSEVLCRKGERGRDGKLLNYYESNSGLDKNGDNKITKSDLAQHLQGKRVDESIFA